MIKPKRSGLKDCWNAYLCEGAVFTNEDIPNCPTTAKELPKDMILWDEAKSIYKKDGCRHSSGGRYGSINVAKKKSSKTGHAVIAIHTRF